MKMSEAERFCGKTTQYSTKELKKKFEAENPNTVYRKQFIL